MKKYLFFIIILICSPIVFSAVSNDAFYSAGSDYLVMQNPISTDIKLPVFYALYDNTKILLDINNDGSYDFDFKVEKGGLYIFEPVWNIVQGTRIHSNKPIHIENNFYFYDYCNSGSTCFQIDKKSALVPSNNYKNKYLVMPGRWSIISNYDFKLFIDENFDGNINKTIIINKTSGIIEINNYAMIYSNKTFLPYSKEGIGGILSDDFISNEKNIFIIAPSDNTILKLDYNNDNIIDEDFNLDKGAAYFDAIEGTRISSNKEISAFGFINGTGRILTHPKTYIPLSPTNTMTNEFSVNVKNDFVYASKSGHYLYSVYNDYSCPECESFELGIFPNNDNEEYYDYENITTGNYVYLENGFYVGRADTPFVDRYYYYYNKGAYARYFTGHTISYKQVYLTVNPVSKYILPNSASTFNIRVFNPFKDLIAEEITVKFRYDFLSMPFADVNYRKASLADDKLLDSSVKTITKSFDDNGNFFTFTYNDILESETYLDINFVLHMPNSTGLIDIPPCELFFKAPTWTI